MNTRLILKTTDLVFKDNKYKVNHNLVSSKIGSTLSFRDYDFLIQRGRSEFVASVYFSADYTNILPISITEANNLTHLNQIVALRNADKKTIPYISGVTNTLAERIPLHYHVSETLENYKRVKDDFIKKKVFVDYYASNFYDPDFAVNTYMFGKFYQITPVVVDGVRRIESRRIPRLISGYIKVENTGEDSCLNIIIRGIPVPMRRTLTSRNISAGTYNYVFTYPQYIINNREIIESVQYIEIEGFLSGTQYWFGNNYSFKDDTLTFGSSLSNLHIINRNGRNTLNINV
jgi:hypothetical protein